MNSAFPRIVQPVAAEAARSLISGVSPMDSITVGLNGMRPSQAARKLGDAFWPNKRSGRYKGHDAAVFLGLPVQRTST